MLVNVSGGVSVGGGGYGTGMSCDMFWLSAEYILEFAFKKIGFFNTTFIAII